jgi:hypothetical protein
MKQIEKGSKVVCIDDTNWPAWARAIYNDFPVKGKIYTVRDIIKGIQPTKIVKDETGNNPLQFTGNVIPVILLEEIHNPMHPVYKNEHGYSITRFDLIEPLVDEKKEKNVIATKMPKKVTIPKKKDLIAA